ncbi:hypothetical protein ONV78_13210 [Hahella sp. CR1]|uniref:hypothetical protein n=1 Tax=Hahella sp. CR1 TaxID=2992807 RepID=UPI002442641C|nr:hypothetical protein [Hahella sp. CR1]MDG9668695.1 hypothetical protein [Hahella sp. CR1]
MRFEQRILHSTSRDFASALRVHGIQLQPSSAYTVWARGLSGKDYPGLYASLQDNRTLKIKNFSDVVERLINTLNFRGYAVSREIVISLFATSTVKYLNDIDEDINELVLYGLKRDLFFMASGARHNIDANMPFTIGIVKADVPGITPLDRHDNLLFTEPEAEVITRLLNCYIGKTGVSKKEDDTLRIFGSSLKAADDRCDENLLRLITTFRKDLISRLSSCAWKDDGDLILSLNSIEDLKTLSFYLKDELSAFISAHEKHHADAFYSIDCPLANDLIELILSDVIEHVSYYRDEDEDLSMINYQAIESIIEMRISRMVRIHSRSNVN